MKKNNNTFQLTILTILLLFSFNSIAKNSLVQQLDAQRPDNMTNAKWQGLKEAVLDIKITSQDGFFNNAIGYSISLDPNLDRAVIGAFNANDNGVSSGLAYVFELQMGVWEQTAKLMPQEPHMGQNFGRDVAIDNNWLVVSAPTNGSSSADTSVYIFFYDGIEWLQYEKLNSPESGPIDNFGLAISLVGNQLLVSDISGNASTFTGAVYEYEFDINTSQWTHVSTIIANDGLASDLFGRAIDLDNSGTRAVVGAPGVDVNGSDEGAIYIFEKIGMVWIQSAKLFGSNIGVNDRFGGKVAISDNTVVATGQFEIGEVYVFEKSGSWQESVVITDAASGTGFGQSIDVDNITIAIGYFYLDTSVLKKGFKIYQKSASSWNYQQNIEGTPSNGLGVNDLDIQGDRILASMYNFGAKYIENIPDVRLTKQGSNCVIISCTWTDKGDLISADTAEEDAFGIAVDISGNKAIIGAYEDDDKGNNAGAAYILNSKI